MSNAPTVFISAATIDLRSWRDLLAKAFRAAQFRVLVQDDSLGAPLGSVRELLSGAILQSDCVIHLAGLGYGGEATDPFPASPEFRCSWTQFEYYHAHEKKIPCIAFVCAPNLSKFEREEDADPERRAIKEGLQRDHCDRVQSGKFDGTPLVSLPRTLNDDVVETTEDLLIRMTKAVAGLQRKYAGLPTEAFEQAKLELNALRLLRTIPPPRVDFVGRQKELEQLRDLATKGDAAIIGLKGMGGIGKTQLAYVLAAEWAMEFPDAWILLDGRGTQGQPPAPAELLSQVIVAFCPDSGAKLPDDLIQLKALYRKILSGKRALILLDNAKDTSQAAPLEPPAGNALIVTSRRSMMLAGRASVTIGEMGPDDAAKLLRDDYEKLANDEVAELVRLCAGLPLALRLAASHLALEAAERDGEANVGAYLYALKNGRLKNLNADAEDTGEITVSETLRLSVEPLAKEEKQAWHRLAIFTSSFCAKAAEAIAGTSQTMLNFFLRRSLLEADGADRYKLHDLAVDYARANLSAEDGASLALAHAVHYEAVGSEADDLYLKGEVLAGLSLFDRERAQIEAAFVAMAARQDLAGAERVIGIVSSVVYVGNLRFHSRQWMVWLENQLRAASKTGNRKAEGDARGNLGNAYDELGEVLTAIEYYRQWLDITREIGGQIGEVGALGNLGYAHATLGDPGTAIDYYEKSLALARQIKDRRGEGNALGNLGSAYCDLGEAGRAIEYHKKALYVSREIVDRRAEGQDLGNLGTAYATLGDARKAIEYHEQSLAIAREIRDRRGEGDALWHSACQFEELGNRAEAVARAAQALLIYEAVESPHALKVRTKLAQWRGESK